jgi:hypothetical protein
MKNFLTLFVLAAVLAIAACSGNQPQPVTDDKAGGSGSVKPASQPAGGGYGSQPGGAQPASGGAPAAGSVEKPADLVALEKAYNSNPQDAGTKKKLVQATYEFGNKVMYDESLAPRVKYPEARRQFKRVLELDPTHQEAAAGKKQIEDIYTSMGRPIPE